MTSRRHGEPVMNNSENDFPTVVPSPGTVYLVGAGPGDMGLITVRGLSLVRSADVIVYDYLASGQLIEEAPSGAELIYVGKKGRDHTVEQVDINSILVGKAREGKRVVRLKGGDPYVFGRGGEEAEDLYAAGIPFEVVPGVSSAVAAPAYAGIPVTHRDHASMVTFVTGHENPNKTESAIDWGILAKHPGTLVFLMGVKNLANITSSLIGKGKPRNTPAALVRWGTTPRQVSLVSTLEDITGKAEEKGIKAPSVLVVGSVAILAHRLNWFERRPLFGRRILITRSRKQSGKMAEKLLELGGDPILFPTIMIKNPDDFSELDGCIHSIADFDWVIFTSVNAVEKFFERFFLIREDIRLLAGPRIAAIGPVTAATLSNMGLKVDLLAKEFVAEGVLRLFSDEQVRNKKILIPRAQRARDILPDGLRGMGNHVELVTVYRTEKPSTEDVGTIQKLLENGEVDAVTFTSSSTVQNFVELLSRSSPAHLLKKTVVASIGPVTSATARSLGIEVTIEATEYTIDGLSQALVTYYGRCR